MKIYFSTLLLFCLHGQAQTGSISGNAYWHYNDYVGDKPDAGSDVYLFSADTSKAPINTQCDVQGNFKFEKVPPGNYLVMIISKNTTDDGTHNFIQFDSYHGAYKVFLGFSIEDAKQAYDSVALADTAYYRAASRKYGVFGINKQLKDTEAKREIAAAQKRRVLNIGAKKCSMVASYPLIGLTMPRLASKIYFAIIRVAADQNKTVIADFGITFS
jgi:hypothetical protein